MSVGLALRELWLSFRLLAVLGMFALAGTVAATAPFIQPLATSLAGSYAAALGVAGGLTAALGASAFAAERRRGGLAWMVSHAVSRPRLLLGWLLALTAVSTAGLVPSGVVAWVSLEPTLPIVPGVEPLAFAATLAATAVDLAAWMAAGLLVGTLLGARVAGATTLLLVAALLIAASVIDPAAAFLPAGGFGLLTGLGTTAQPLGSALHAMGVGLLALAVLSLLGMAAISWRDL